MPPRWRLLPLIAALALLPACVGDLARRQEADAAWRPQTTVETPVAVVDSPWDAAATEAWVREIERQALHVANLLDADFMPELRVRLVPVPPLDPTGDPLRDGLRATDIRSGHVGGYFRPEAGPAGTIVLYVPEHPVSGRVVLEDRVSTLRHELTHAFGEQLGWGDEPLWFTEGVARVVEEIDVGEPRWDGLVPLAVLRAPVPDARQVIDELIAWRPVRDEPADSWADEARRYDQAGSLAFFLLSYEQGPFDRRCRVLAETGDDQLRGVADAWSLWLLPIDPYVDLARGLRHGDVEVRRDAMLRLRELAQDPAHWDVLARLPHVELAVLLIDHPRTYRPAAAFLLEVAADRVSSEDVARLAGSADTGRALLGQALLAERGERVDRVRVATLWAAIPVEERLARYGPLIGPLELDLGDLSTTLLLDGARASRR